MSVRQAIVDVARKSAWQRPTESHQHQSDVTEGDVLAQQAGSLGAFDHLDDRLDGEVTRLTDLLVAFESDASEQRGHDGGDAIVERPMHVAEQRAERVGFFGERGAGFGTDATEHIQRHGAHQRLAVGKAPIQRGDADAGAPSDLIERRVRALLDEHVARGGEEVFAVAARVGAQSRQYGGNSSIFSAAMLGWS